MICHLPLVKTLGGAKVYIEAATCYELLGHHVKLVGINEIVPEGMPYLDEGWRVENFPSYLESYILENADRFDVVEYESIYLPLRVESQAVLVARSVLLDLHQREIKIPSFSGLRSLLGRIKYGKERKEKLERKIASSMETIRNSDLVNIPNPDDRDILIRNGVACDKIIIQPYGIFKNSRDKNSQYQNSKKEDIVAFVGTFDNRKGAVEFPKIVQLLIRKSPSIRFKLLGVIGMFQTAERIIRHIGIKFEEQLEIVEKFSPEELGTLLKDCKVGVFPSHLESFGFGVLEMMSMGIPVVAYDCPGVNQLVPQELLVSRGDVSLIVEKLDKLLSNEDFYNQMLQEVREKVEFFTYENRVDNTIENYRRLSLLKRANKSLR